MTRLIDVYKMLDAARRKIAIAVEVNLIVTDLNPLLMIAKVTSVNPNAPFFVQVQMTPNEVGELDENDESADFADMVADAFNVNFTNQFGVPPEAFAPPKAAWLKVPARGDEHDYTM